jgi:hypothetical protein
VVAEADDSDSYVCRPWPPGGIREALVGHKVTGVDRVGKQLLVETDGPVLGLHLGMRGSLRFDEDPAMRFKRFALAFSDGGTMVLRDPRRLGRVTLDPVRGRLGPDALAVSPARFRDLVGCSRAPVKARLLNQQALAGVGNLLADEALWRAGIDPRRRGVDLDPRRAGPPAPGRPGCHPRRPQGGRHRPQRLRQVTRARALPPPRLPAVHRQGRRPHDPLVPAGPALIGRSGDDGEREAARAL